MGKKSPELMKYVVIYINIYIFLDININNTFLQGIKNYGTGHGISKLVQKCKFYAQGCQFKDVVSINTVSSNTQKNMVFGMCQRAYKYFEPKLHEGKKGCKKNLFTFL